MGGGEDFKRELGQDQEKGVAWQNLPMYRIDYAERLQAIERTQRDFDQRLQRIQTDQRELADRVQAVQSGQLEYDELLHEAQNAQKDLDQRSVDARVREVDVGPHPLEKLGHLKSLDDRLERIDARISSLDHRLNGHMNSERGRKKAKEEDALVRVQSLATEVDRLGENILALEQREKGHASRQAEAAAQVDVRTEEDRVAPAQAAGDRTAEILAEGLVSVTQTLQSELDTTRLLLLTGRSAKRRATPQAGAGHGWSGAPQWSDLPREDESA